MLVVCVLCNIDFGKQPYETRISIQFSIYIHAYIAVDALLPHHYAGISNYLRKFHTYDAWNLKTELTCLSITMWAVMVKCSVRPPISVCSASPLTNVIQYAEFLYNCNTHILELLCQCLPITEICKKTQSYILIYILDFHSKL